MRLVWMHLPLLCIENNAKGEKMALNDVSTSVSESDYKGGQVLGAFAEWSCQMSVSHQASWSRLLFADDDDGGLGGGFEQAKLINLPLALLLLLLNPPPPPPCWSFLLLADQRDPCSSRSSSRSSLEQNQAAIFVGHQKPSHPYQTCHLRLWSSALSALAPPAWSCLLCL